MCGLTGFSSKASANTDKLALLMYHNSVKRGEDNTGFYTPEEGVKKDNIKAEEFLAKNPITKCHTFIGHVRKSSVGGKLAECSHPFEEDNLVLAHNGTLTGYIALATTRGIPHASYKVDSQVLAKALDQDSKEGDKFKTLSEFEGPAALLFSDKRFKNILYAYTNGQRPLFYGYIDQSMYISSTEESLKLIQAQEITAFKKCVLYTIKFGKIVAEELYEEKKTTTYTGYRGNWRADDYYDNFDNDFVDIRNRTTNGTSTTNSRISSITIKNNLDAIRIAKEAPMADAFVDKWLRVAYEYNGKYVDQQVNIKKDKWYLCNDSCFNNWDLKLEKDEVNSDVTINKYMFDYESLNFDSYGIIMANLNSKQTNQLMFSVDDVVEILDYDDKRSMLTIYHPEKQSTIDVSTRFVRSITKEERELLENRAVETVNENLNLLPAVITKLDEASQIEVDEAAVTDCEIIDEVKNEQEPDEALASYVLDIVSDSFDDILELVDEHTTSDKLKLKISEHKDLLDESYNFKLVKETMADDQNEG